MARTEFGLGAVVGLLVGAGIVRLCEIMEQRILFRQKESDGVNSEKVCECSCSSGGGDTPERIGPNKRFRIPKDQKCEDQANTACDAGGGEVGRTHHCRDRIIDTRTPASADLRRVARRPLQCHLARLPRVLATPTLRHCFLLGKAFFRAITALEFGTPQLGMSMSASILSAWTMNT